MKNILLAVTGLSPQVITETMYALHQNNQHIDEIHVITTRTGKEKIFSLLLGGENGWFFRYLEEYEFKTTDILFDGSHVHVICDEYGNELEDISSVYDNEKLLEKCLELTFRFTSHKNTAVFFSVAGGRKTMSSCLTLAAQLYGRPCDRLYHVLVSPEFENSRNFFYPPRHSHTIELTDQNGQPYYKETKFAEITFVNMPFVSIRNYLSSEYLKEPKDPATLMLSLVKEETPRLTVNLPDKKILFRTIEADMIPTQMALYAFFINQKKNCTKTLDTCKNCTDCFLETSEIICSKDIVNIYKKISGPRPVDEMSTTGIMSLTDNNFRSLRTRVNKRITTAFGQLAAKELEITSIGKRPDTRYGILMDKNYIQMVI